MSEKYDTSTLPLIPLRGMVAFPRMGMTLNIGRKRSVAAIKSAMENDGLVFVVTQLNIETQSPKIEDIYKLGCVCKVRQCFNTAEGCTAFVEGVTRAETVYFFDDRDYIRATVKVLKDETYKGKPSYKAALLRKIKESFEAYREVNTAVPEDIAIAVATSNDLPYLCDYIAFSLPAPFDDKQFVLEKTNIPTRAKTVLRLLSKETQITKIDRRISEQTKERIDDSHREYYLKEQIKVINDELYGSDDGLDDTDRLFEAVAKLNADESVKDKLNDEIRKFFKTPPGSQDGAVLRTWLDLCLSLPWNNMSESGVDIKKARKILDRDFYGMEKVKERVLEMLSVYALSPDITGQILCLAGPPGVGKTSIGKTVAECMGREFAKVSLGGLYDEAEIRGHRRTYVGAMQGKIISALKSCKTSNPVILLDEIDKVGRDGRGDPCAALLEVLDPEQNSAFVDNYVDIPVNLSKVVFMTTANDISPIPAPLLDRMEVISLDGYTREEKFCIAKKHLISKQLKAHALTKSQCRITDGAVYSLIDFYTREAGVRKLERSIASLCSKTAKLIASGERNHVAVNEKCVEEMLGKKKYRPEVILENDETGIVNGLAWTAVGGEIMQLEVLALNGSGKTVLTGSLGDVMKESAQAAVTFVRANAEKYGVDEDFFKTKDIHIHATEAAVPKDGPSAGITIATGLVSALTGRKIRRDIAMTGEITIKGRVLPIGGLKEKAMAAYRGGVKTVFIPKENIPDLEEVDETVKRGLTFVPVAFASEVLDRAFVSEGEEQLEKPPKENPVIPAVTPKRRVRV